MTYALKAFPSPDVRGPDGAGIREGELGMDLRDWFAGLALMGILAGKHPVCARDDANEAVAACAYRIADEMMVGRKGGAA